MNGISWTDFFRLIGAITAIYYGYVIVRFYPHWLKAILTKKNDKQNVLQVAEETADEDTTALRKDEEAR